MMKADDEIIVPMDTRAIAPEENLEEGIKDEAETIPHQSKEDIQEKNKHNSDRALRDRSTLKRPNWYEANITEFDEPTSYNEAVTGKDADKWKRAIDEELKAHETNETWVYQHPPPNKKAIESKWVFKIKRAASGRDHSYKARLCAKGFTQKYGIDYHEVFSSVARYDSIRLMLAVAAKENLEIAQFDVKTAFLNGDLSEEIYMKIPEGVKAPHWENL